MTDKTAQITTHVARMAMNRDPEVRAWVEEWLKARERERYLAGGGDADDEAFEKHWRYVRPETMHEGAVDGYRAYVERDEASA
jgi:hypothetical protein